MRIEKLRPELTEEYERFLLNYIVNEDNIRQKPVMRSPVFHRLSIQSALSIEGWGKLSRDSGRREIIERMRS